MFHEVKMAMKISRKKIWKEVYIAVLGMLGFSMLGQYVLIGLLHFPFSLMEVYYIPFLYVYRKDVGNYLARIKKRMSWKQVILLLLMVTSVLSGMVRTYNVSFVLEYRSILYMIMCFGYVKTKKVNMSIQLMRKLAIYTMLGELMYILVFSTSDINSSVNCVAIAMAILASFLDEKYLLGFISFSLGTILGVVSGFRIGILISVIALAEALCFNIVRMDKKKWSAVFKRNAVLVMFVGVGVLVLTYYEPIVMYVAELTGMSQFAIFRVTERMRSLLAMDFTTSQDVGRLEIFRYPLERFWSSIMPRGLIGTVINEYWLYIDVPILYLYDLFGSIGSIVIIAVMLVISISRMGLLFKKSKQGYGEHESGSRVLAVLMMPIFLCLFVVNGTFMVIVFQAIQTAIILGILCQKRKAEAIVKVRLMKEVMNESYPK